MQRIDASTFKARCLTILDEVANSGEEILIVKNGKPVARLLPPVHTTASHPQARLRGTVHIHGDIVGPPTPDKS